MGFKVDARTIFHLGAELISSDAIAFYELIKNAFDAGSAKIHIDVVVRIPFETYTELREGLSKELNKQRKSNTVINKYKDKIVSAIVSTAPYHKSLQKKILEQVSLDGLLDQLERSNYIRIEDFGHGMSLKDLDDIYLTIGTRHRLDEREALAHKFKNKEEQIEESIRPVLGEKGVGRLSAMRLGTRLLVKTTKTGEKKWNTLNINWQDFSHKEKILLEKIDLDPKLGVSKKNKSSSGTILRISALTSEWDAKKLEKISDDEFNKFIDPFSPEERYELVLRYNNVDIEPKRFNKILFKHAHAKLDAKLFISRKKGLILKGTVDYCNRNRKKTFVIDLVNLLSISDVLFPSYLKSLGPFNVELYWYNRSILEEIKGIGSQGEVRKLVNEWSGGLKLYRDGFRVNPYGSPEDDWLSLDKKALASSGYKVNRKQIIGKVDISTFRNPKLIDQTNREGLNDCKEKEIFRHLLQYLIAVKFKKFLDEVDKEVQAREPIRFEEFADSVQENQAELRKALKILAQKYPEVKKDTHIFPAIESAVKKINDLLSRAASLAEEYDEGRAELIHLSGLGLMVETISHELTRATDYSLAVLRNAEKKGLPKDKISLFETLEAQLETLDKRLRNLDPLSARTRQVKVKFDMIDWVRTNLDARDAQLERHDIKVVFKPKDKNIKMMTYAVKGMVVQIIENLLNNSIYWIKQYKKLHDDYKPEIIVKVDINKRELHFIDNGPGIEPERSKEIFQAFVTSKPPKEGHGLGLFISQELAKYNDSKLYLLEKHTVHPDKYNTFVLAMEPKVK